MREKLIELLESTVPKEEVAAYGEVYVSTKRIADHLIANGVTLDNQVSSSKWIPVSERLPEDYTERVIVKIKDGNNIVGHPDMDTDRYWLGGWVRWGDNVTHWMPLPEPPKGE